MSNNESPEEYEGNEIPPKVRGSELGEAAGSVRIGYDDLKAAMPEILQSALDNSAEEVPDGYHDLSDEDRATADRCYEYGMQAVEAAVLNWLYDRINSSPNAKGEAQPPAKNL